MNLLVQEGSMDIFSRTDVLQFYDGSGVVKFAVKSDRGMVREINEDSYNVIAGYPGIPVCFLIADGMGGHNSGEIASKMAVDFVSGYILKFPELFSNGETLCDSIRDSIEKANKTVFSAAMESETNSGMGTTLTIAVVDNKKLYIGHVGDSRVFLIRGNEMIRLTTDHTYIEELVKNGSITREEASGHPKRNILTRAVGCERNIKVDTYVYDIKDNDLFLMCTDGLTNMLSEFEMLDIVRKQKDLESICNELVMAANDRGGEDNITVITFRDE